MCSKTDRMNKAVERMQDSKQSHLKGAISQVNSSAGR